MIIQKQKENEITTLGEIQGFDMQLSNEDLSFLMSLLGDIYKDPYSIIPQEYLKLMRLYKATCKCEWCELLENLSKRRLELYRVH